MSRCRRLCNSSFTLTLRLVLLKSRYVWVQFVHQLVFSGEGFKATGLERYLLYNTLLLEPELPLHKLEAPRSLKQAKIIFR